MNALRFSQTGRWCFNGKMAQKLKAITGYIYEIQNHPHLGKVKTALLIVAEVNNCE